MTPGYLVILRFIFLQTIICYAFTHVFYYVYMSGKHDITFLNENQKKLS